MSLFLNGFNVETNLKRTHYYFNKQKLNNESYRFIGGFLSKNKRDENFITHSEFLSYLLVLMNKWLCFEISNQTNMLDTFERLCKDTMIKCNITICTNNQDENEKDNEDSDIGTRDISLFIENDRVNYYNVSQYEGIQLPNLNKIIKSKIELIPAPQLVIKDLTNYTHGTFLDFINFLKIELVCDNRCVAMLSYPIHCVFNKLIDNRICINNTGNKNLALDLCPTVNDLITYHSLNEIFKN